MRVKYPIRTQNLKIKFPSICHDFSNHCNYSSLNNSPRQIVCNLNSKSSRARPSSRSQFLDSSSFPSSPETHPSRHDNHVPSAQVSPCRRQGRGRIRQLVGTALPAGEGKLEAKLPFGVAAALPDQIKVSPPKRKLDEMRTRACYPRSCRCRCSPVDKNTVCDFVRPRFEPGSGRRQKLRERERGRIWRQGAIRQGESPPMSATCEFHGSIEWNSPRQRRGMESDPGGGFRFTFLVS